MSNKTGTKEWAARNLNIQQGCEHNCRYCYARYNAVNRFKRCSEQEWCNPVIDVKKVNKNYRKRDGVIMFPSSHDITPNNISICVSVLRKLVRVGNKVLIVTKPHLDCIKFLCEHLKNYKSQILFRFTIGSISDDILKFWETGAPGFEERMGSLKFAYNAGYQTSVSAEPFLDGYVHYLYEACKIWLTDSFWIGKLRDFKSRVDLTDVTGADKQQYVQRLLDSQTDEAIRQLHKRLNGRTFIRWKDSIRKAIGNG